MRAIVPISYSPGGWRYLAGEPSLPAALHAARVKGLENPLFLAATGQGTICWITHKCALEVVDPAILLNHDIQYELGLEPTKVH